MILTKRDGSPAPKKLKVTREWTYDVNEAAEALAEFTDGKITYEDVYDLIASWVFWDVREPVSENLPAIVEDYEVTDDTAQKQDHSSSHWVGINPRKHLPIDGGG